MSSPTLAARVVPLRGPTRALARDGRRVADDRAAAACYRDLAARTSDVVFVIDVRGRLRRLNPAGRRLLGIDTRGGCAVRALDLIAPGRTRDAVARWMAPRQGLRGRVRRTVEVVAADGRRVGLDVDLRMLGRRGRAIEIHGVARPSAQAAVHALHTALEQHARQIAQALHDDASQFLATVYLELADVQRTADPDLARRLERVRDRLDGVDAQIRRLAHELRPARLESQGLLPACRYLAEGAAIRTGTRVSVTGSIEGRLHPDTETSVYRVIQEALTNAVRHGRPGTVSIELCGERSRLAGRVVDDGAGFDPGEMASDWGAPGLGLTGMRERISALGGILEIRSSPGRGTAIEFILPLE